MTYERALSYLVSLNESRIKPGLERIRQALSALGSPHFQFPHVLVGGTNGKGSVVTFMGATLTASGYRTGLFTSPHLHSFEERIVIGSKPVTRREFTELVSAVRATEVPMTYFEFATAMALLHFARQRTDIAVLEVGIGGRWDATNATHPVLSVITSVAMDHEKWLGHTVEEVALEKSGIMREGNPVVVGPLDPNAVRVVLEQGSAVGARVILYGRDFSARPEVSGGGFHFRGLRWDIRNLVPGMKGVFQHYNAACALAGLETLASDGFRISQDAAARSMASARWPGRFHEVAGQPPVIVDSAHNLAAVRALVASLEDRGEVVWLFSSLSDKDVGSMTAEMSRLGKRFVLAPLDHPRARTAGEMAEEMAEGLDVRLVHSVGEGVEEARRQAGEKGTVVAAGSVVLAGAVLRELGKEGFEV